MKNNILANFVGRFWALISNFLFIPLYIKYLGFESYSIISFTLLIAGIMAVLDAGLSATLSREFARKDNTHTDKIRTFKTLEASYLLITVTSIFIVFLFSNFLAVKWINLEGYESREVATFLKIISFDIGFQLLYRFYSGGLLGLDKQVKANFYQVGLGILRNGLVVLIIIFYPTLDVFFLWQTSSTILFTLLIKLSLEKDLIGKISINFSTKIEKNILKKNWGFAGGMLLIAIIAAFNTQMDKIIITKLLSLKSLGYYTLALSLSQVLIAIANPISIALLPKFTSEYSQGNNQKASFIFNKFSVLVSILIFGVMANMSFFAKDLIWVWTGNLYVANQAYIYLPIISLSMSMLALASLPYQVAISNGYTKLNNILGISSLLITIPGYFLATRQYGAIGAAFVFCFVQSMTTFIYIFFINKKFLKSNILKDIYWKQYILPFSVAGIVAFLFSKIPMFVDNSRIFSLIWIGFVTFATLVITLAVLVPYKEIKSIINFRKSKI